MMQGTEAARNYKNNLFVDYMGTKEHLIEVYNAVKGTDYPKDADVKINTLQNVLFRYMQNDISFILDGKLIVLIEHQSSLNENMPIRMLEYVAKVYEQMIDKKAYYKRSRIMLPRPEFIVFYNGRNDYGETGGMKLSESFLDRSADSLELSVAVYNLNHGMNADILEKSRALNEYVTLTAKVREYENMGHTLEEAVANAVKYCMDHGVMVSYLNEHGSDIMSILVQEYSYEDELQVAKEEAAERVREEGRQKERENARRMKADGMDAALISKYTGLPVSEIEQL